jgi:phytoene synthase
VINPTIYRIFRNGSTTYFTSTLFFPPGIREDVFVLYSFVRTADDLVDSVPQQAEAFGSFVDTYRQAAAGEPTGDTVIDSFVDLSRRADFDPAWTDAFLSSMEMDLSVRSYRTLDELSRYLYGSAEVIGLFMARILRLPPEAMHSARLLGRAMQYINFIRDISEDIDLGRVYFPEEDISRFDLEGLSWEEVRPHPGHFARFIDYQLDRYSTWQHGGEAGFHYIPRRTLIPIRTASDMYSWTAGVIRSDPFIVFQKQVKPSRARIIATALKNMFSGHSWQRPSPGKVSFLEL